MTEPMGDIDISLRALAAAHPDDVARGLFPGADVRFVGWRPTNLALMERRADEVQELLIDGARVLSHTEWELAWSWEMAARMYEYHCTLVLAQLQRIAALRKAAQQPRGADDPAARRWSRCSRWRASWC